MKAAVVTVSDGVAEGTREDKSGDLLTGLLGEEGYEVERRVVPDDRDAIADAIAELAEEAVVVRDEHADPVRVVDGGHHWTSKDPGEI